MDSKIQFLLATTKGGNHVSKDTLRSIKNLGLDLAYDGKSFRNENASVGGDVVFEEPKVVGVVETIPVVEIIRLEVKDENLKRDLELDPESPLYVDVLYSFGKYEVLGYGVIPDKKTIDNELRYVKDLRGTPLSEVEIARGNKDLEDIEFAIRKLKKKQDKYPDLYAELSKFDEVTPENVREIEQIVRKYEDDEYIADLFELEDKWDVGERLSVELLEKEGQRYVLNGVIVGVSRNNETNQYETVITYSPYRVDFKVPKSEFAKLLNNDEDLGQRFKDLQMFSGKSAYSLLRNKEEVTEKINKIIDSGRDEDGLFKRAKKAIEEENLDELANVIKEANDQRYGIIRVKALEENLIDLNKLLVKGTDGRYFIRNLNHSEGVPLIKREFFDNLAVHNLITVPRIIKDVGNNEMVVQKSIKPAAMMDKDGNFLPMRKPTVQAYAVYKTLHNIHKFASEGNIKQVRLLLGDGLGDSLLGIAKLKKALSKRDAQYIEFLSYVAEKLSFVYDTSIPDEEVAKKVVEAIESDQVMKEYLDGVERFYKQIEDAYYNIQSELDRKYLEEKIFKKEFKDLTDTKGLEDRLIALKSKGLFKDKKDEEIKAMVRGIRSVIKIREKFERIKAYMEKIENRLTKEKEAKNYSDYDANPALYALENAKVIAEDIRESIELTPRDNYRYKAGLILYTKAEIKEFKAKANQDSDNDQSEKNEHKKHTEDKKPEESIKNSKKNKGRAKMKTGS